MTGQSQKSKRKNLFGFERPCSYPRFVLFGNFLENALDAARRATHTPRASLPRTPTNLPSFPQSLADPNLNLPHRRLPPPPPHTEQTQRWPRRDSRSTPPASRPRASRAPPDGASLRNRRPPRIPRSIASRRSFWRVRRGASASTHRATERTPPPTSRGRSRPRRPRRDSIFFALGADEAAPRLPDSRAMRCNAAAKGIQGDGKVQLCISKEQFDAINDKAGDSLVRTPPYLPPQPFSQTVAHAKRVLFVINPKLDPTRPNEPPRSPRARPTHARK